jgi:hypothetical protein
MEHVGSSSIYVSHDVKKMVDVLVMEHAVILKWADDIIDDIDRGRDSNYISDKIDFFWEFLLEHLLKEDSGLYCELPELTSANEALASMVMIYNELEEFFNLPYPEIVANFKPVVDKIKARVNYEESFFLDLHVSPINDNRNSVVENSSVVVSASDSFLVTKIDGSVVITIKTESFEGAFHFSRSVILTTIKIN